MHLLNDAQSPEAHPARLSVPFGASSSSTSNTNAVSLPPLEPDLGQRGEHPQQIPSFHTLAEVSLSRPPPNAATVAGASWLDSSYSNQKENIHVATGRTGKAGGVHPLQLLLEEPEPGTLSKSLRLILDKPARGSTHNEAASKKRQRGLVGKDDYEFVQLPQPPKKQKSTQNVVPPIINGLLEPPPDPAMFPPMAAGLFDDDETPARTLPFVTMTPEAPVPPLPPEVLALSKTTPSKKVERRVAKPRRKWTEEETNHLLLGVSRHGVGKWTVILEDPEYKFNDRTAGDLKDRFRTCCPAELRNQGGKGSGKDKSPPISPASEAGTRPKSGLPVDDILIETDDGGSTSNKDCRQHQQQQQVSSPETRPMSKPRKSRAHRRRIEDLAELGIRGPFKKSLRRERRPFTERDDKNILGGLHEYGPAWTKIQRDPKYHLGNRQPTDLRDRVRNKYPDVYTRIEKGNGPIPSHPEAQPQAQQSGPSFGRSGVNSNLLEPSVHTTIENTLATPSSAAAKAGDNVPAHLTRSSSKDDLAKWAYTYTPSLNLFETAGDTLLLPPFSIDAMEGFSGADSGGAPTVQHAGAVGEMDISRLLLDDQQLGHEQPPPLRLGEAAASLGSGSAGVGGPLGLAYRPEKWPKPEGAARYL